MSETLMTLRGRAANNPELHMNTGRTPMCFFRIGVNHRYFDRAKGEWVDGRTEWYSVVTFGNLALNTSYSIRRGDPVIIYGRFRTSEWQPKDGGPARLSLEIVASSVGHDLRLGATHYSRRRYDDTGRPVGLESASNDRSNGEATAFVSGAETSSGNGAEANSGIETSGVDSSDIDTSEIDTSGIDAVADANESGVNEAGVDVSDSAENTGLGGEDESVPAHAHFDPVDEGSEADSDELVGAAKA